MTVADLLTALSELRAGRVSVEQLVAACSAWSNEPHRPLADFLKPGAVPAPLAEPASGVLGRGDDSASSLTFRRGRRAAAPRPSRARLLVAGGVGLVALIGMGAGLGYLARSNARLEEANARLRTVHAELEQTNAALAAAHGSTGAFRLSDPKPPVKGDPGRDPVGSKQGPNPPTKDLTALVNAHAQLLKSAGPDDPRTVRLAAEVGLANVKAGRVATGIQQLEDASRRAAERGLPDAPAVALSLAHALWATGQAARAVEVCEHLRDDLPAGDPLEPEVKLQLARAYRANGQWDKARFLFEGHLVAVRKKGKDSWEVAQAQGWVAECELRLNDPAGADPVARESLDLWAKRAPGEWPVFAAKSLLGEVLLFRRKYDEAEKLLREGYDGLKGRRDKAPWDDRPALPLAAGRLARLYEARGDKDRAAEWKRVEEQDRQFVAPR